MEGHARDEALIWHGVEQDMYWTGRKQEELPVEKIKEIFAAAVKLAEIKGEEVNKGEKEKCWHRPCRQWLSI